MDVYRGEKMKINRTYSIDHWIAVELQKKSNQSRFVNDAIRAKLDGFTLDLSQATTFQLMVSLENRSDVDPFIKRCLKNYVTGGFAHRNDQ